METIASLARPLKYRIEDTGITEKLKLPAFNIHLPTRSSKTEDENEVVVVEERGSDRRDRRRRNESRDRSSAGSSVIGQRWRLRRIWESFQRGFWALFKRISWALDQLFPYVGYGHILMVLCVITIILLALPLAGCSSTTHLIPDIYIISLSYHPTPSIKSRTSSLFTEFLESELHNRTAGIEPALSVRASYFGICYFANSSASVQCTAETSLKDIYSTVNVTHDPLGLLTQAVKFWEEGVFPYLIIISIVALTFATLLIATFPGWHRDTSDAGSEIEVKPFPSRVISNIVLGLLTIATVFQLVSIIWQQSAAVAFSVAIDHAFGGYVKTSIGTTSLVLGWVGFALAALVWLGMVVMILSIRLMDGLDPDDDRETAYTDSSFADD